MTDFLREEIQSSLGSAYTLTRELGGGGMSRVFVARDQTLGRDVVVKVLSPELAEGLSAERFAREIRTLASLQQANIVPLLSAGSAGGMPYYIMPFVEGESLRARLGTSPPLSLPDTLRILGDVARALQYAHDRGIVHRDVKPDNVLLSGGTAVVTDFGIAKAVSAARTASWANTLTQHGASIGTPAYMAPEQAAADPDVDHRVDIYALGCLAYELLAGAPPFHDRPLQGVLAAHLTEAPQPIGERHPDLPASLCGLVMRCLAKNPADRPQRAAEVIGALDALTTGTGIRAAPRAVRGAAYAVGGIVVLTIAFMVLGAFGVGPAGSLLASAWHARQGARALSDSGAPQDGTDSTRGVAEGAPIWPRAEPAGVSASPSVVAVLPFQGAGGTEAAQAANEVTILLSTNLDGAGNLRDVDPRSLAALVSRTADAAGMGPAQASAIAGRFGAGQFVMGDVLQAGTRLRITASLYDRSRMNDTPAPATVEGMTDDIFGMVDRLTTELLAGREIGPRARLNRVASVTTSSVPALKAYLTGELAMRAGRYGDAVDGFTDAVQDDTTFALAYYRLAVAEDWAGDAAGVEHAADHALQNAQRLTPHDLTFLQAFQAAQNGDGAEAERLFRRVLERYPDDGEAWFQLGEVLFHLAPLRGRPTTGSLTAFQRASALDPGDPEPVLHLARIAALEGDESGFDSLVARYRTIAGPSHQAWELGLVEAVRHDSSVIRKQQAALRDVSDGELVSAVRNVAIYGNDLAATEQLARLLTEPQRDADARAVGNVLVAYVHVARGQLDASRADLQRGAAADLVATLEFGSLLATAPFLPASPALFDGTLDSAAWAARLAAMPPRTGAPAQLAPHDSVHTTLRMYALGLLAARKGAADAARAYARNIRDARADPSVPALLPDLASSIRANAAARAGDSSTALRLLEAAPVRAPMASTNSSPYYDRAGDRFLHAELLHAAGRDQEAIGWYESFGGDSFYDLPYIAPSEQRLGEIYAHLGQTEEARRHLQRFVALWAGADPALQPAVRHARAELNALAARGR